MEATRTCSVDGCDRRHYARSWCKSHYGRWRLRGHPEVARLRWAQGDQAGYHLVHTRLMRERGPASRHACIRCGGSARNWAYQRQDNPECTDDKGRAFGRSLDDYAPMCVACHRRYDFENSGRANRRCAEPDCDRTMYARDLCEKHYQRLKKARRTKIGPTLNKES